MIQISARIFPAALLVAAMVPVVTGCSASPGAGGASAAAVRINGQEIPASDFEAYLAASFGEDLPPVEDAETRSRLLDQFIEERLLLQQAEERKIHVEEAKVDAYLTSLGAGTETGPGGKPVDAAFREQIRHNLLIEEFKDQVLLKEIHVAPEEVEAYYRDHPEEFREPRAVVLRQILLEDAPHARQILAHLKEAPDQFQLLAERNSVSPDKGQPRPYEEEELPEAMRAKVFALEPGQISDVVEDAGKYRIFQAVDRHDGKNQTLEEVRKRIEMVLLQRKAEEALSRALADLKSKARIKVHRKNLPFTYKGEYGT
jgi:parvulin-like peptidyl-prolyl isomerase